LKFCPNCGTKNENEAKSCSNCGNSLESQFTSRNTEFKSPDVSSCIENNPAYKRRRLNLIIIAVFIAIVGLLLIIVFASGSDDSNDTSVAEIVEETKSDQTFLTTETDMVISSTTVLESTENKSETETEIETVEASEPEQIIENALKSASGESNVSEISVYYNQANDYYTVDYHFIGTSWDETSFLRTIMSDYINTYRSVSSKIDVTLAFFVRVDLTDTRGNTSNEIVAKIVMRDDVFASYNWANVSGSIYETFSNDCELFDISSSILNYVDTEEIYYLP